MGFFKKNKRKQKNKSVWDSWTFILLLCVVLPLSIRSFFYSPFHIPSGSMKSTLLVGDYLFVSKHAYGYSRYSFPMGYPLFEGRIMDTAPERGDVVVFRTPANTKVDYIKRLIGLPGDTVQMIGGALYLNGTRVERQNAEPFVDTDENGINHTITRYKETLPNGVSYYTLDADALGPLDTTPPFLVPKGHYFFLGDNRDRSSDSRVMEATGFVPAENLVGKAEIVLLSSQAPFLKIWEWVSTLRTERFALSIE